MMNMVPCLERKKNLIVVSLVAVLMLFSPLVAGAEEEKSLEEMLEIWMEEGIDPNHSDVLQAITDYIQAHIDPSILGGIYIDRSERLLGTLVLQFTEEIEETHKKAIADLVVEPAEVEFRVVRFSEAELEQKQQEIVGAMDQLEQDGIHITHVGTDIILNQVEVGINPYSEELAKRIDEQFGSEMVHVIEAEHPVPLLEESTTPLMDEAELEQSNQEGWLKKTFRQILDWVQGLFSS